MRVGIVGAGLISQFHLKALRDIDGVSAIAILDKDAAAAERTARSFGVASFHDDPDHFYREARPDIVHVLTPPQVHREVALDALRRGVHVFVEKPMAMTPGECDAMASAAEAGGVTIGVDHTFLFDPRVVSARHRIAEGRIGDVMHVETLFAFDVRRLPHFSTEPGRRTHWSFGLAGGLLEDLLPHPLYLTHALLGEMTRLEGWFVKTTGRLSEDLADELRLGFSCRDATANLTLSLNIQPDVFQATVYGSKGTLRLDLQNMILVQRRLAKLPKAVARGVSVLSESFQAVSQTVGNAASVALGRAVVPGDLRPMLQAHYGALMNGGAVPVGADEGRSTVEMIRQIWPA